MDALLSSFLPPEAAATMDFTSYKCGSGINANLPEDLKTLEIPPESQGGMEALGDEMINRIISAVNGAYKIVTLVGTESLGLTMNMTKALQACNCGVTNGGRDMRYFISAAFYFLAVIGQAQAVIDQINPYWGYVTTCEWEANQIQTQLREMEAQLAVTNAQLVAAGQAPIELPFKGAGYNVQTVFSACNERAQRQSGINCNKAKKDCGVAPRGGQDEP